MPATKVKFCINAGNDGPLRDSVGWWKACEDAGIDMYGIADSPIQRPDVYVSSTLCALNTDRIRVATCVTNPVTRDPSVTASCLSALEELAPGRVAMGIATGDSALWGVGLKPATVASLREYILAVKGLLRGEEVSYQGRSFKSQLTGTPDQGNIPVYVACSGPRVLRMAAQVADGLIVTMGVLAGGHQLRPGDYRGRPAPRWAETPGSWKSGGTPISSSLPAWRKRWR